MSAALQQQSIIKLVVSFIAIQAIISKNLAQDTIAPGKKMEQTPNRITSLLLFMSLCIAGCQPISDSNPRTGNLAGAIVGGAGGAAAGVLLAAPRPVIGLAAVGGAA